MDGPPVVADSTSRFSVRSADNRVDEVTPSTAHLLARGLRLDPRHALAMSGVADTSVHASDLATGRQRGRGIGYGHPPTADTALAVPPWDGFGVSAPQTAVVNASQDGGEWFPSVSSSPFLDRARRLAPARLGRLVLPMDTWGMVERIGPLLAVDVPGVPDGEVPVIDNHAYVLLDGASSAATGGVPTSGTTSTSATKRRSSSPNPR